MMADDQGAPPFGEDVSTEDVFDESLEVDDDVTREELEAELEEDDQED